MDAQIQSELCPLLLLPCTVEPFNMATLAKTRQSICSSKSAQFITKKTGGKTLHESNFYDVSYKLKQIIDLLAEITKGQYIL